MALNKFMHPRNIYKTRPDFNKLAKTYEEFSKIAKVDVSGKISIDFKDPHSLRILTQSLLKADFNLDVFIPEDRLVPTLPLRLNYILWIEDLMSTINKIDAVYGLDIGTGACAIYPLLAAVKNKWHMVGTETDSESLQHAKHNITKNNLQKYIEAGGRLHPILLSDFVPIVLLLNQQNHYYIGPIDQYVRPCTHRIMIAVRENTTKSVIEYLFLDENSQQFEFCMCNPPFYTNIEELWESRSPARPEPKNGFTGSPHELITEGGELQFCRKIIEESKQNKDKILIFTTMVGHKFNLKELVMDLKADGIKYTTTEFCQGRVTRWGLAWTYQNYDFSKLFSPRESKPKKNIPISFSLPEVNNDCNDNMQKLKCILQDLQIIYKVITKRKNELILDIAAMSNTWSNQRRKRRILKRLSEEQIKKAKIYLEKPTNEISEKTEDNTGELHKTLIDKSLEPIQSTSHSISNNESLENHPQAIVHGVMKINCKDMLLKIEIEFLNGSAGKEGLHQIAQYIKNNWK